MTATELGPAPAGIIAIDRTDRARGLSRLPFGVADLRATAGWTEARDNPA